MIFNKDITDNWDRPEWDHEWAPTKHIKKFERDHFEYDLPDVSHIAKRINYEKFGKK